MAAQKGPLLKIKKGNGDGPPETFTNLAGIRSKTVNQNAQNIDITTDDDINASGASFRTSLAGIIDWSVSGSGVAKDNAVAQAMMADFLAGTVTTYQVEWPNVGTWEGEIFIEAFNISGEVEGAITFDITLRNNAAVDFTAAA